MPIFNNTRKRRKFKNVHGNYKKLPYKKHIQIYNSKSNFSLARYKETSKDFAELISMALLEKKRLRIVGSNWSLSKAQYVNSLMAFTINKNGDPDLKYKTFLKSKYLQNETEEKKYLFAQTGNTIEDLNLYTHPYQRSLQASGASNGQTISGAIGTGVHGSGIYAGSIQDSVVALHIIRGPKKEDSILVQPASNQVLNNDFAKKIGATLLNDDDTFHSALVSVGTFGIIHSVIIETVPRYKLVNRILKLDIADVYKFTRDSDITDSAIDVPKVLRTKYGSDANKKEPRLNQLTPENLYHVKFFINQHHIDNNVRAEIIYKIPDPPTMALKLSREKMLAYKKDILIARSKKNKNIADLLIPSLINKALPKPWSREEGYLNEMFPKSKNVRGFEWATAVAVKSKDAKRALELMLGYFDQPGGQLITGLFSLRFVKKSKATLAFTKFNKTCIIGVDGPKLGNKKRFDKFMKYVTAQLALSDIKHAWHWGKVNNLDSDLVKHSYKTKLTKWKASRKYFLDEKVRKVFSSDYTDKLGLTK